VVILVLVAAAGLAVVLVRDSLRQVVVYSLYGLLLTVLFVVFQAPDVALSMLAVGSIACPLVLLVAVDRVREKEDDREDPGL